MGVLVELHIISASHPYLELVAAEGHTVLTFQTPLSLSLLSIPLSSFSFYLSHCTLPTCPLPTVYCRESSVPQLVNVCVFLCVFLCVCVSCCTLVSTSQHDELSFEEGDTLYIIEKVAS